MKTMLSTIMLAMCLQLAGDAIVARAGRCMGVKPIRPIKPIGCGGQVLMCVCSPDGDECHWEWVCVN